MSAYWPSLIGGMLLGIAAMLLLLVNGRVAGISGVVGRLLQGEGLARNAAFVIGLVIGPWAYGAMFGGFPEVTVMAAWPVIILAGLAVGFGTRMGSGCTSGHGIIGLARLSPRSIAATATFLVAGMLTATLMGALR